MGANIRLVLGASFRVYTFHRAFDQSRMLFLNYKWEDYCPPTPAFIIINLRINLTKGGYMNSITDLLDLEDADLFISDTSIEGNVKTLTLETHLTNHYCPCCGFRMHSRGIKTRKINHPILQDGYELILLLRQRRWRCTNPDCLY